MRQLEVPRDRNGEMHTVCDVNLVSAALHSLIVVSLREFAEIRKPGSPHPDLERFVLFKIRRRINGGIALLVSEIPVWRRGDIIVIVRRRAVQMLGIAGPRDALIRHIVSSISPLIKVKIQLDRVLECIIENRVGDQTTRVIRLIAVGRLPQRIACAGLALNDGIAFQLIRV